MNLKTLSSRKNTPDRSRGCGDEIAKIRRKPRNPKNRFGIIHAMDALQQAQAKLLYWAKHMIEEETRWMEYVPGEDDPMDAPPSWYPELVAAVTAVETEGGEAME